MPDLDTLFPGRFLKGRTLEKPITVRIVSVTGEPLEGDDGDRKPKGVMRYRTPGPDGKPVEGELVLAKTNALLIAAVVGSRDIAAWAGHKVTIGFDPSVMFGSECVGGIRVVGSPELKADMVVEITRPRRKRKDKHTLRPTDDRGQVRTDKPQAEVRS